MQQPLQLSPIPTLNQQAAECCVVHQLTCEASGTMYSASFANRRLTISAANFLPVTLLEEGEEEGEACGCLEGISTREQSAAVIRGRATRHSWRAINTSLGLGLGYKQEEGSKLDYCRTSLCHLVNTDLCSP